MADQSANARLGHHDMAKTLLVLDDEPDVAELIVTAGLRVGFVGHIATHANELLRLLDSHTPTIITLDLRIPGSDGVVVLRELAAADPTKVSQIVA